MTDTPQIEQAIKSYILEEFLPGEDPAQLTASTPLITAGILDSIATLKLVGFLEKTFSVAFAAHEVDTDHLNTIERITQMVQTKGGSLRA